MGKAKQLLQFQEEGHTNLLPEGLWVWAVPTTRFLSIRPFYNSNLRQRSVVLRVKVVGNPECGEAQLPMLRIDECSAKLQQIVCVIVLPHADRSQIIENVWQVGVMRSSPQTHASLFLGHF
jgi:hypothetical protein